ncbi:hypothetical protein Ancab_001291 [Ancistrocladus abbreviatus]
MSSRGDKPHFKGKQSKDKEKAIATDAKEQSQGRTPECFLRRTRIEMARSPRPRCCHCCSRITYLVPTRAKKEKVGKKPSPMSSRGDKPHFKGKQSKDKEKAIATDAKEQSQGRTPECFLRR